MHIFAAVGPQPFILRDGFHPFGNHQHPELFAQVDHTAHQRRIPYRVRQPGYQMPVELEGVQLQVAQVRQGARAGPEVIQCHSYAQIVQQA
ncbi:hypothetical protein D3C81_1321840 [compost metagenome]